MTSFVKDCIAHVRRSYIIDGMMTFSKMPVEGTKKERKITLIVNNSSSSNNNTIHTNNNNILCTRIQIQGIYNYCY